MKRSLLNSINISKMSLAENANTCVGKTVNWHSNFLKASVSKRAIANVRVRTDITAFRKAKI